MRTTRCTPLCACPHCILTHTAPSPACSIECWDTHRPSPCLQHCILGYTLPPPACSIAFWDTTPWTERMTHACENIPFPVTRLVINLLFYMCTWFTNNLVIITISQRIHAKVMFSQACVILSTRGWVSLVPGGGYVHGIVSLFMGWICPGLVMLVGGWYVGRPGDAYPSKWIHLTWDNMRYSWQVGGIHPTEMLSCFLNCFWHLMAAEWIHPNASHSE